MPQICDEAWSEQSYHAQWDAAVSTRAFTGSTFEVSSQKCGGSIRGMRNLKSGENIPETKGDN
jgi:hypothetical protein